MILICSCSQEVPTRISYDCDLSSQSDITSLIENSRSICLETREECLVSNVDRLKVEGKCFYIQDSEVIYKFDHSGKFLSKIASRGRAANEYLAITDFDVYDGSVYVLSHPQKKIVVYDEDDEFLRLIEMEDFYHNLSVGDGYILLYSERSNNLGFDMVRMGHDGEILNRYFPFKENQSIIFGISPFQKLGPGEYYLTFPYDNRVLFYSESECHYSFDIMLESVMLLSDKDMDRMPYHQIKDMLSGSNHLRRVTNVIKRGNKIFLLMEINLVEFGIRQLMCRINTSTGECVSYLCGESREDEYPYFSNLLFLDENTVYSVVDPLYKYNVNRILGKSDLGTFTDTVKNPEIYLYDIVWN